MYRWLTLAALTLVLGIGVVGCTQPMSPSTEGKPTGLAAREAKAGEPAVAPAPANKVDGPISVQNYLVIGDARLDVIDKTDVPSQRDGQLLYVATEVEDGKPLPPPYRRIEADESFTYVEANPDEVVPEAEKYVREEGKEKKLVTYRRLRPTDVNADPTKMILVRKTRVLRKLREGDDVVKGQLLAVVDPAVAVDEFLNKKVKVDAAKADYEAAIATRKEAEERYNTNKKLYRSGTAGPVVSYEDLRSSQMTFDKYTFEAVAKQAGIGAAERELSQVLTTLRQHEIRAKINGVIKSIQKQTGEAVRNLDTVLQIQDHDRIRVEGYVGIQHLAYLEKDGIVTVEPLVAARPKQILSGHLQEVRSVAVSKNGLIVSGSDDRTMRVWDRKNRGQTILAHPAEVRAVACTPKGVEADLCLSGDASGTGRIWNLADLKAQPITLAEKHKNPITTAAFSPDGKWCLTGSVDRTICLWDSSNGNLISRFPEGHRGEVTSVAFLSPTEVVSAGSDKALVVWSLDGAGKATLTERRAGRSHDVPVLGVNPAGKQVLFDQGKEIRILSEPGFAFEGVLQNPSGAANFTTMALFSPDGKLILTAGSSEGRLQLWRAPTAQSRAYELRQLVWPGEPATCGAFSPGSDNPKDEFVVTGTKDRQIVVWEMPDKEEIARELHAKITLLEQSLDSSSRQVRIWAELDNPKMQNGRRRLMPGAPATMVVYPSR